MNTILIDSHVLIWMLYESNRLGKKAIEQLEAASIIYISSASLWELTLKHTKQKLAYKPTNLFEGQNLLGIKTLDIKEAHLSMYHTISLPHSDPFDTLLAAQAVSENIPLLTADSLLLKSKIKTINAQL